MQQVESQKYVISINFGYNYRIVLKHVLRPYNNFFTYTTVISEL